MAMRRECPLDSQIAGLRLKRKCGQKVTIVHQPSGQYIIVQVVSFWDGHQVTLAFEGDQFIILRAEADAHDLD